MNEKVPLTGTVALVDRGQRETDLVTSPRAISVFAGFRFPPEVISVAVRWYLRYGLSYRDVEELLAERGITVDHVTVYRWVQRFTPEFIEAARPCRHAPGDRWFVDETYVKVAGQWTYLYRAVDQHGQVIDVLLSGRRDLAAARRFFVRALRAGTIPVEVTTDRAPVYPRVLDELVPSALHSVEQHADNPIETDHGRLKARVRPMRGLKRHRGSSPRDTPSCRTCAAATTTSPPKPRAATGSASPSTTSRAPSEPTRHHGHFGVPREDLTQQCGLGRARGQPAGRRPGGGVRLGRRNPRHRRTAVGRDRVHPGRARGRRGPARRRGRRLRPGAVHPRSPARGHPRAGRESGQPRRPPARAGAAPPDPDSQRRAQRVRPHRAGPAGP